MEGILRKKVYTVFIIIFMCNCGFTMYTFILLSFLPSFSEIKCINPLCILVILRVIFWLDRD